MILNLFSRKEHKDHSAHRERAHRERTIPGVAIVGNMCVGKSTLFAKLCGTEVKSVNYPGTTVSIAAGNIKGLQKLAFDTPGTCSIFTHSEDERVSRDFFLSFDQIKKIRNIGLENDRIEAAILVADAKNLKRSLALAVQYAEYGVPMLLDINMMDEAHSRGIVIDHQRLSDILGIDVCCSVATEGEGIKEIKAKLTSVRTPHQLIKYPQKIEDFIRITEKILNKCLSTMTQSDVYDAGQVCISRGMALLLLVADKSAEEYVRHTFGEETLLQIRDLRSINLRDEKIPVNILLTNIFNKRAEEILAEIYQERGRRKSSYLEKFSHWCMHLETGIPIALAIIYLMYLFIGVFAAGYLVDLINNKLFAETITPWVVCELRTMTLELICCIFSSSSTWIPESSGISISRVTKSGFREMIFSRAVLPLSA
ncbi:MAG: ferrous iron transporter B [Oligoflexia bacterium]|nr:ferrous iron transporter B [Oligoflexia bacterium]